MPNNKYLYTAVSFVFFIAGLSVVFSGIKNSDRLPANVPNSIEVTEYYNSSQKRYFMTTHNDEKQALDNGTIKGWQRTGFSILAYDQPTFGLNPVCRFYGNLEKGGPDTHFYSANSDECNKLNQNPLWIFEETAFYIGTAVDGMNCPSGTLTIYRFYNNSENGVPNHRYLSDSAEMARMQSAGWTLEGAVFCAQSNANLTTSTSAYPTTTSYPVATTEPPTTNPPLNPPPPGSGYCSQYADVQLLSIPISHTRTIVPGYFGGESVVAAQFTVPAGSANGTSILDATAAEWQGPPTMRNATISTQACDFRSEDSSGAHGPLISSGGTLPQLYLPIGANRPRPHLIPGQTYYFNVRNSWSDAGGILHPTCPSGQNCKISITIVIRN